MKDKIELKFIDVDEDDLKNYSKEVNILNLRNQLPITFIAGRPVFTGQVDKMKAYLMTKKIV